MAAARPKTLPAAVVPVAVATAHVHREGLADPVAAGLCLVFALLVQVGTNLANDYYDWRRGADTAERRGPPRAVASGWITPAGMRRAMAVVLVVAFLTGLPLVAWGGPWLVPLGVACVVAAWAYTGGPYPLAYHGLGEVFVFVFFGLVAVLGTSWVQTAALPPALWAAGSGLGFLSAALLVANNHRDRETDARAGKRTVAVRIGRVGSLVEWWSLVVAAGASAVAAGVFSGTPWVALAGVAVVPLVSAGRALAADGTAPVALPRTAGGLLLYGSGLAVAWVVG